MVGSRSTKAYATNRLGGSTIGRLVLSQRLDREPFAYRDIAPCSASAATATNRERHRRWHRRPNSGSRHRFSELAAYGNLTPDGDVDLILSSAERRSGIMRES
jgi:hypothetical protein